MTSKTDDHEQLKRHNRNKRIRENEECKNNLSGLEICLKERRLLQLFYHQSVPSLLILKSNEFLLVLEALVFISAVKITQKVAEV